ncbi:MAG: alpha-ketoacid dehydrogenase subunit beta [Mycobacteriales bacterium]
MQEAPADAGERAEMTAVQAMNSALHLAMARDPRIVLLGEDIADPIGGVLKVTKGLSDRYGTDRVRATPISETAIIGAAVGLALGGYRPVPEVMFMDFTTVCLDQIVNHAAKLRYMSGGHTPTPMTIRTAVGTRRFGAQHSQNLEGWFMHVPGLKVVIPARPSDAKGLLASCLIDPDPCLFVEHIDLAYSVKEEVPIGWHTVPLGVADTVRRGSDVTVVTYGTQVAKATAVAEDLGSDGVSVEVIDLRTLVPLDIETVLESVARTRRAVVLHDAHTFAGPGAELAAQITEQLFGDLLAPVLRVGAGHSPVPFASSIDFHPGAAELHTAIEQVMSR